MAISTATSSRSIITRLITPSSSPVGVPSSTGIRSVSFPSKVNHVPPSRSLTAARTTTTNCLSAKKAQGFIPYLFSTLSNIISPPPPSSPTTTTSKDQHQTPTQILHVYELNEGDRHSPAFLKLSKNPDKCLGDLVPFSNKLYSGDLKTRFGISAGMIIYIEDDPEGAGDRYEAIYSFYFGAYGHLSAQGAYFSRKDSELVVTGGTGIFEGVTGKARLSNVIYPLKLYYVFELKGLKDPLPQELVGGEPVKPTLDVKASPDAKPLTFAEL